MLISALPVAFVFAQSASEIQSKIEDRSKKIDQLELEIKQYEATLTEVSKEKKTLQSAVNTLDISRKKVSTDITLTERKIGSTDLTIQELESEIIEKEKRVLNNKNALAETLRTLNNVESDSLVETVLAYNNLSEIWDQVETLERFQYAVRDDVAELTILKAELESRKNETERKRDELAAYQKDLSGKKQVLDQNRTEKDQLLKATQNKESGYQKLLEEKRAAYEQFSRELQDLETQLKYTLDPNSIPTSGQGILAWPLSSLRVTQHFGNTLFAQSGAYAGQGHNGMDFAASPGTAVKAALGGVVGGIGNTDTVPGCYSYGKWILLRHNNGLATLYAHLSVINVNPGATVNTGETIGYSGNTGYSTGPHLHFTVYVSDAVKIVRLGDIKKITNCGPAYIPIAALEAYLNPLDYLQGANTLR